MSDVETTPIQVQTSPLLPVVTALVRQAITAAGAALVAHGIVSQGQVDATLTPATLDQIVGGAMVLLSAGWAWWKANHTTAKFAAIDNAVPDSIVTSKGS